MLLLLSCRATEAEAERVSDDINLINDESLAGVDLYVWIVNSGCDKLLPFPFPGSTTLHSSYLPFPSVLCLGQGEGEGEASRAVSQTIARLLAQQRD